MCSQKQFNSNRENAQKSTGPKTDEGKKIASQNAVKHGLNSATIILTSPHFKEDQEEYDHLAASLKFELQPQTPLQEHFVYKIINCHWRYRRLISAETAQINKQTHPDAFALEQSDYICKKLKNLNLLQNFLASNLIPKEDESHLLSRYEYRLSREIERAYKLLRQLQSQQKNLDNTLSPWVIKAQNQKQKTNPVPPNPMPPNSLPASHCPMNTPTRYSMPSKMINPSLRTRKKSTRLMHLLI